MRVGWINRPPYRSAVRGPHPIVEEFRRALEVAATIFVLDVEGRLPAYLWDGRRGVLADLDTPIRGT
jgi:hypothetical protein